MFAAIKDWFTTRKRKREYSRMHAQLQSKNNEITGAERQIESLKVYLANQRTERDAIEKDLLEFQELCKK